jgi:hypothetical protein
MPAVSGLNKSVFTAKAQKGFQRKGAKTQRTQSILLLNDGPD